MHNRESILIVEDDEVMSFMLEQNLNTAGYRTSVCPDGESALKQFRKETPDLCLLDVMLPKMDGFALAKMIRKENQKLPFVFLTARNMTQDKLTGFKSGADDYISKPFDIHELLLRIQAILRRTNQSVHEKAEMMICGNYRFNPFTRDLTCGSEVIRLSTKEADLLGLFISNKNQLLPRQLILQKIWGNDNFFSAKSMDVYLTRIRKLIQGDPKLKLVNIHGTGYRFVVEE